MRKTAMLVGVFIIAIGAVLVAQQVRLPLPPPGDATPNRGQVVPRPDGAELSTPPGFTVRVFADGLQGARLMEYAPSGDLFVSQPGANAVTILRDTTGDGAPDMRAVYA